MSVSLSKTTRSGKRKTTFEKKSLSRTAVKRKMHKKMNMMRVRRMNMKNKKMSVSFSTWSLSGICCPCFVTSSDHRLHHFFFFPLCFCLSFVRPLLLLFFCSP
jgi:hypothetical protein